MSNLAPSGAPSQSRRVSPTIAFPLAWGVVLLVLFTTGGVVFGAVFVRNMRVLASRSPDAPPALQAEAPVAIELPDLASIPDEIASVVNIEIPRLPEVPVVELPSPLPTWSKKERVNILLLGIDRRSDQEAEGSRSDTVMVLSVDPVRRSAVLLSMPRDLWVSIPGYGDQRINVAHAVGGPELVARTVEANFGVPVDYWARIDFVGFERVVDTLGGVLVDVERPIKDDEYPTEDYGYMRIYIPAGPQLLDGKTALQYARSRHSENDFGRARRQQRLLVAIRDRALALNMLPRAPALISEAQAAVATSFSTSELIAMARLMAELDEHQVDSVVFDTRYADPFIAEGGANVLLPNRVAIRQVVARVEAGQEPEPPRVEVLNGSSVPGLAAQTADLLGNQGYQIVRVAPADRGDYRQAEIVVLGPRLASAIRLASVLAIPESAIRSAPASDPDVDLRLIVGEGFHLPVPAQ